MMESIETVKKELVRFSRKVVRERWVIGSGGNLSIRLGDVIYIKAKGMELAHATTNDFVGVELNSGALIEGLKAPSIELKPHLACYRARDDVRSVFHAHPTFVTCVATAGVGLGAVTTEIILRFPAGVPRISYRRPGSDELAEAVTAAIKEHNGVLLSHHGAITVGANLEEAFISMQILEEAAKVVVLSANIGTIQPLKPQQVKDLLTFYK